MRNKVKNKLTNRQIAVIALFVGMVILFTLVIPWVGLPNIIPGVLSAAFVLLIIVGVAALSEGLITGIAAGTAFGIASLISSFVFPTALSPCFHNPLISVLPRVFIGAVVFYTHKLLDKVFKPNRLKASGKVLRLAITGVSAAVGAFYNTVSVLGLIFLFYGGQNFSGTVVTWPFIMGVVAIAGFAEFAACLLLTPPIAYALERFKKIGGTAARPKTSGAAKLPDTESKKAYLRAEIKASLGAFPEEERAKADAAIFERVTGMDCVKTAEKIMIYKSFGREADTSKLADYFFSCGKRVFAPRISGADSMQAVEITGDTVYEKNSYGIDQPIGASVYDGDFDVLIIPLLAFDKNCNRLGRGKGYYDKFLKGRAGLKLAIAYSRQKTPLVPTEESDVQVDAVVTEDACYKRKI